MFDQIKDSLKKALTAIGVEADLIPLELTADLSRGDIATSVALQYAKAAMMPPRELAEKIVETLEASPGVAKIEIAGAGFINFFLEPSVCWNTLRSIIELPHEWGRNDRHAGEKIMVEYTDPNPFKEFHIGHLMSNAIGESIARLVECTGADVARANYQGDVGPHVAKAIWAIEKLHLDPSNAADLGKAYAGGAAAYENDAEAKKEIDAINAQIYDKSNPVVNEIYKEGRKASLEHFEEIYQTLGTSFDHYFFESDTAPRGIALVNAHPEIFTQSDGAIVYKGEEEGLHTRVFITSRATPTYETKDLGLLALKREQGPLDRSITITAHEQSDYFAVMLAAARRIGELENIAAKTLHRSHGMMRFASGKMSSRTGNVITGESLLDELTAAARERAKESRAADHELLARHIAVAAIKYQILKQASGKDIIFEKERALSLEGDSGPYLQYTFARASQVVAKAQAQGIKLEVDFSEEPIDLVRQMIRFPAVVERAAAELEPHLVANFILEFAAAFNRWYAQVRIVEGADAPHKVAVTEAVRVTIGRGLYILGIPAPEKM